MSLQMVEAEIAKFLTTERAEVLCINGKWGVGKTYSWNRLLKNACSSHRIALKSYAYVSLFGINSLDQLKFSIFENTVAAEDAGIEASIESFQTNADAVMNRLGRKALPFLQSTPVVRNYASALQSLSFLSVRKCIVCIDDLERKGNQLAMKDVLGLIAHLRDLKGCKLVLILNDGELDGSDKADFERFNEKVIDKSVEFAPTATDCARIALVGVTSVDDQLRKEVTALGISNIRIIKKIERYAHDIAQIVTPLHPSVLRQAVQSTVVFTWSAYSKDAPDIDFLCHKRGKSFLGLRDDESTSPLETAWNSCLDEIGFGIADDFDLLILKGIQRGFFDEPALLKQAQELDKRNRAIQGESSVRSAWQRFHGSFDDNEQAVVDGLLAAYRNEVFFVSPASLDGLVTFLKHLGRGTQAAEAISFYVESRKEDRKLFDLGEYAFGDDVADPDVRAAFDGKYRSFPDERSPVEVLLRIGADKGWSPEDKLLLSKLTSDELYEMFKYERDDTLTAIVRTCLWFERIVGVDGELKELSVKAKEALVRIGKESTLNYRRVKKYGIDANA